MEGVQIRIFQLEVINPVSCIILFFPWLSPIMSCSWMHIIKEEGGIGLQDIFSFGPGLSFSMNRMDANCQ